MLLLTATLYIYGYTNALLTLLYWYGMICNKLIKVTSNHKHFLVKIEAFFRYINLINYMTSLLCSNFQSTIYLNYKIYVWKKNSYNEYFGRSLEEFLKQFLSTKTKATALDHSLLVALYKLPIQNSLSAEFIWKCLLEHSNKNHRIPLKL